MVIDEKQPDEKVGADRSAGSPETTDRAAPRPEQGEPTTPNVDRARPRRRGFATMDRDRVKQIASKGGRAAHAAGTAHQFSSDEARVAGKKGGMAPHVRRGGVRRRAHDGAPPPTSPDQRRGDGR